MSRIDRNALASFALILVSMVLLLGLTYLVTGATTRYQARERCRPGYVEVNAPNGFACVPGYREGQL